MGKIDAKKLINPPKEYRPIPFWSWNDKLDTRETAWQAREIDRVGLGGYFMHARGRLQTEYMSGEWFDNVKETINQSKTTGMKNWGYDENGWPSGFAAGKVNGLGLEYWQKYLRCELTDAPVNTERTIGNYNYDGKNAHIYYDVNDLYVDLMDPKVTKEFIKQTHEVYKKELGSDFKYMEGFFTDEPQLSRDGLPWSFVILDEYKKRYGDDLKPKLLEIFYRTGDYTITRYNYWELVRDLFSNNYLGQIYKWCQANGTKLTGHMVLEEGINIQITANSAVMANYEFFDYPGFDCLCRILIETMGPTQVASVAHQLGKKHVLSETFALAGHGVNFEDLRHMYEYQMVRGTTLLCEHLFGYSLRGIRKRDYPPALFYHQPWWNESNAQNDLYSRIGMLLSDGEVKFDVLVMHPQSSAWIAYDEPKNRFMYNFPVINETELLKIDRDFVSLLTDIEKEQVPYHLGDERIINRYGKVDAPALKSDECKCDISDKLRGNWDLVESGDKLLVLDYCDCYFDGELIDKDTYVLDLQERACDLLRSVKVDLDFKFNVEASNTQSYKLLVETPEKFDISINGESINNKSKGYMFDKAFEIVDLEGKVVKGQNTVRLSINFTQSEEVYKNYSLCTKCETIKNKFYYDNELECIYLAGDFGVNVNGELKEAEKKDTFFDGKSFTIVDRKPQLATGDFVPQGLPFFAGDITVKKNVTLSKEELNGAFFKFDRLASAVATVKVNGKDAGKVMWKPYTVNVSDLVHEGENEIEITLTTTLRNLLGPHHSNVGDQYIVSPGQFFKHSKLWSWGDNPQWADGYSFINMGLYI